MILTWLNVHIWGPMWPNIFAPSAITLAAILVSHLRTRLHIRTGHVATTAAVQTQLAEHRKQVAAQLAAHCTDIKTHVSTVAEAQVSAGSGGNPGQSGGLAADERLVPPAATTSRGRRRSGGSEL